MINRLCEEIMLQKAYLSNEPLASIYFGGGTPSLLDNIELDQIMNTINQHFSVTPLPEITLEANPDDLSPEKLVLLKEAGINRLSIGIQSFHNSLLQSLNRAHSREDALQTFYLARQTGFKNVSIDLMYGIPGQDMNSWKTDVEQALALSPEHISAYSLTIEDKTTFGKWKVSGRIKESPEDDVVQQMEWLINCLTEYGYEHYEISNFAKNGFHSIHNSNYWCRGKYLGIGPSAHSYNGETRQYNVANNNRYMKSIEQHQVPFMLEELDPSMRINEYILTSLRTSTGCDLRKLKNELFVDLEENKQKDLTRLIELQLVTIHNHHLILTRKGLLLADFVATELFQ